MRNKFGFLSVCLSLSLFSVMAQADSVSQLTKKSRDAANVLASVVSMRDRAIPNSLLERATCVATVPNVIRIGFVFGARYGKGLVSCRVPGGWSRPSFIKVTGGSWGAQFGIQSIDLVLVFARPNAVEKFSKTNFTVGADATVAAGPLGRDAQAGTDYKLNSEIYSYSRARGLFAGLAIQGTAITVDKSANSSIYGNTNAYELLTNYTTGIPASVASYVNALDAYAH